MAESLLLRHPLAALPRPTRRRRVRPSSWDELRWVLGRRRRRDGRRHLVVATPDPVVRGHRAGWRRSWRWRSRAPVGRPRLSREGQDLIARLSRDDPRWGTERLRGELLEPGIAVSRRSIRRSRPRRRPLPPRQAWRTFLANHAHAIWAAELCGVQTRRRSPSRRSTSRCASRTAGASWGTRR